MIADEPKKPGRLKGAEPKKVVGFNLRPDDQDWLRAESARTGRTMSEIITRMIGQRRGLAKGRAAQAR